MDKLLFKTQTGIQADCFEEAMAFILEKTAISGLFDFYSSFGRAGFSNVCASAMRHETPNVVTNVMFDLTKYVLKTQADIDRFNKEWMQSYGLKITESSYEEERIGGSTYRTYGLTISRNPNL
ncbi:MAG: hypothetical protein Q8J88_00955 [Bacteroidales bacterium]|nr:hypothetical protein [Bacteroidales bacterium]